MVDVVFWCQNAWTPIVGGMGILCCGYGCPNRKVLGCVILIWPVKPFEAAMVIKG